MPKRALIFSFILYLLTGVYLFRPSETKAVNPDGTIFVQPSTTSSAQSGQPYPLNLILTDTNQEVQSVDLHLRISGQLTGSPTCVSNTSLTTSYECTVTTISSTEYMFLIRYINSGRYETDGYVRRPPIVVNGNQVIAQISFTPILPGGSINFQIESNSNIIVFTSPGGPYPPISDQLRFPNFAISVAELSSTPTRTPTIIPTLTPTSSPTPSLSPTSSATATTVPPGLPRAGNSAPTLIVFGVGFTTLLLGFWTMRRR